MRKSFSAGLMLAVSALLCCATLSACKKNNAFEAAEVIKDIPTVQAFLPEQIPDSDLNSILQAGINAQSGMNGQPWHFSVVKSKPVQRQIADELRSFMPKDLPESVKAKAGFDSAPVAIVVSGKTGGDFDCALATQAMVFEAAALGYGTKIIASPNIVFHGERQAEYKSLLKIPEDMQTIAVLLVGKADEKSDALSSATIRKSYEEVVSVIE